MEYSLEKLRAQERNISITGETLSRTEQCVRELDGLEKRAQVTALCFPVHVVVSRKYADISDRFVFVSGRDESGSGSYPAWASAGCWTPLCHGSDCPALQ